MRWNTPTKRIKELCRELGSQYRITLMDGEVIIYRDFGNGYDVEISGVNHNSQHRRATIFLWEDKSHVVRTVPDVFQGNIGDRVEELYAYTRQLISEKSDDVTA